MLLARKWCQHHRQDVVSVSDRRPLADLPLAGGCALQVAGACRRLALRWIEFRRASRVLRDERDEAILAGGQRPLSAFVGCGCLRVVDILLRAAGVVRVLEALAGKLGSRARSTN